MTGYRPVRDDDRAARSLASRAWSRTPAELEGQAFLGKALVHAILHLADQVRISNLLTLTGRVGTTAGSQAPPGGVDEQGRRRPDVARTLGVTTDDGEDR